ncbi:MAG: hypothetical protein HW400_835 [Candidatus Levybacteria bacterium]|nr:hypothetical protein [Candidatus Levybacteria bacterium]
MVKFGRNQQFTKVNIKKLPNDKAAVYKINNKAGDNLYTGIAGRGRIIGRLLEHKDIKKEVIPGGTRIQIAQVKTKEIAEKVEKLIIKREQPKFNEQNK